MKVPQPSSSPTYKQDASLSRSARERDDRKRRDVCLIGFPNVQSPGREVHEAYEDR